MSNLLLRIALAFAFFYPAYGFWKNPTDWIGYVPQFVQTVGIPEGTLMILLAVFHFAIAFWILSSWRIFTPSLVAVVFLLSVVYFNRNQIDILFRDISLALASLALAWDARRA